MSNGHTPPARSPGPLSVDWSEAPQGATHHVAGFAYPWHRADNEMVEYWDDIEKKWVVYSDYAPRKAILTESSPRPTPEKREPPFRTGGYVGDPGLGTGETAAVLDGPVSAKPLLPVDWFRVSPSGRMKALIREAEVALDRRSGESAADKMKEALRETLSVLGRKKLVEIPEEDTYTLTKVMVVLATRPKWPINWERINEITQNQIARAAIKTVVLPATGFADTEERAARKFPCEGYERLHAAYQDAHHHAAYEKGNERHANDLPFHEQRMQTISQGLNSPDGMAYQVIKKVQEGLQMEDAGARRRELLGALNYLAGIVIFLDDREAGGDE